MFGTNAFGEYAFGESTPNATAPSDTTLPVLTGSVTITAVISSGATASWPAGSDDVGVAGYEYSCDTGTPVWVDNGTSRTVNITGKTASTAYTVRARAYDAAGNRSTPPITGTFSTTAAADTTAPTLSAASSAPNGVSAYTGSVTTDEGNGTLYYLASTSTSQTAAQVKAGATQAITSAGAKSVAGSGLTASTIYYLFFLHRDAAGNDSAVLRSPSFTTASAPVNPGTIDASKIPASRTVTFAGNKRVVTF